VKLKVRIPCVLLLLATFIIALLIFYYVSLLIPLTLSSLDYAVIFAWVAIGIIVIIIAAFLMGSHTST
jgi:hypothetical protein